MKNFVSLFIAAILGSAFTYSIIQFDESENDLVTSQQAEQIPVQTKFASNMSMPAQPMADFRAASEKSVEAVVHIKAIMVVDKIVYDYKKYYNPIEEFFGLGGSYIYKEPRKMQQENMASGSGVIISNDGYIVTNNHVIKNADKLQVVLNDNQTFIAEVVGADPSTDLAVLKVDANDLPYLEFANSDATQIGDWVLAVGNPFNLSSTVTAGIISAKARNINILKEKTAVESFIQTDAAVNPGNSGGALVNLAGNLIGVNTAIATPTGTYAGYSFAVPSNLARKVTEDLIKYGTVQRAYLGVELGELNEEIAQKLGIDFSKGVFVSGVVDNSAADKSGIKEGDVLVKLNNVSVRQRSDFLEKLSRHRPGETVKIDVVRNGKEKEISVLLKNEHGETGIVKKETRDLDEVLGIEIKDLTAKEMSALGIDYGVWVKKIHSGRVKTNTEMQEGFLILSVDNEKIKNRKHFQKIIESKKGGVMLEGVYPGYYGKYYYAVAL